MISEHMIPIMNSIKLRGEIIKNGLFGKLEDVVMYKDEYTLFMEIMRDYDLDKQLSHEQEFEFYERIKNLFA